jgi:Group II intron, maturase-specific domain.
VGNSLTTTLGNYLNVRSNYFAMGNVAELFDDLDRWIRTRLRSKVFRRYTVRCSNRKMPNRVFRELGLVSLVELRRARLSPG